MTPARGGKTARSFKYDPQADQNLYVRLFRVLITHNYYNQNDNLCPDFRTMPTPAATALMADLGLMFKDERNGFSVFIRPSGVDNLIKYIRRNGVDPSSSTEAFWSRLGFLMVAVNPAFISITSLPIDTKPTQVNFFACNDQAHREDQKILLAEGDYLGAEALYPVVGASLQLNVPSQTRFVSILDLAGAVVETCPVPPPPTNGSSRVVTVDFSNLSYDFYSLCIHDAAGQPIESAAFPYMVLYLPAQPTSMGLLDMIFTQPTPDSAGIYPLPPLFGGAAPDLSQLGTLTYQLAFDARATYWQYYIISQNPGGKLSKLRIEGQGASFHVKPPPVPLPDGSLATLFVTDTSLPLRQTSTLRFQLHGQRRDADGQENAILVTSLPVAPSIPVWPGPAQQNTTGTSEMFVYV